TACGLEEKSGMALHGDLEKTSPGEHRWKKAWGRPVGLVATLLTVVLLSAGCATMKEVPPLARRVVVLNFTIPEDMRQNPKQIRGWWLHSRTILQSPNAGSEFADALARHLTSLRYLEQNSRADLDIYLSSKRKSLMDNFKGFPDTEYSKMLEKVSPVDYGEELGVEQVITGHILESYTSENRLFLFWSSHMKVRVDVWDMTTGKVTWTRTFSGSKWFYSRLEVMNRLAPEIVKALDRDYYQRLGQSEK
ncbi:MAG TPA: hypothetical protein PLA90_16710, partial [Candidatus Sumerlaeota bacterium]|nr:hypothetical protein [Candidatus Sumerlaeota bacterium]